ncbi:uncharacterized protein BXZ73DRAFT_82916 [Epithele typhae]|uniref:uncharacterized protein n=1 Tax=Epithele typhae TaxID=378194 RepID=UPI002008D686|nr:uncharacterized protein BXZ73DRAFT_82916 [Epithele typhae]KAH9911233.1 hypothetical protein BXZ73DRAFT_82916 [Epithele typhae]
MEGVDVSIAKGRGRKGEIEHQKEEKSTLAVHALTQNTTSEQVRRARHRRAQWKGGDKGYQGSNLQWKEAEGGVEAGNTEVEEGSWEETQGRDEAEEEVDEMGRRHGGGRRGRGGGQHRGRQRAGGRHEGGGKWSVRHGRAAQGEQRRAMRVRLAEGRGLAEAGNMEKGEEEASEGPMQVTRRWVTRAEGDMEVRETEKSVRAQTGVQARRVGERSDEVDEADGEVEVGGRPDGRSKVDGSAEGWSRGLTKARAAVHRHGPQIPICILRTSSCSADVVSAAGQMGEIEVEVEVGVEGG